MVGRFPFSGGICGPVALKPVYEGDVLSQYHSQTGVTERHAHTHTQPHTRTHTQTHADIHASQPIGEETDGQAERQVLETLWEARRQGTSHTA